MDFFFGTGREENGKPDVIHLHYPVMMLLADVTRKIPKKRNKNCSDRTLDEGFEKKFGSL